MNNGINSLPLFDPGGNILCCEFSGRDDLTMALIAEPASKIEDHAFENSAASGMLYLKIL